MSLLTSGAIARAVGKTLNGVLAYDITLHKRNAGRDDFGNSVTTFQDKTVRGLRLGVSEQRKYAEAVPEATAMIIIVQHDAIATPKRGDQISANGIRYALLKIVSDPANAVWECFVVDEGAAV